MLLLQALSPGAAGWSACRLWLFTGKSTRCWRNLLQVTLRIFLSYYINPFRVYLHERDAPFSADSDTFASKFLPSLRSNQSSVFWNLVWHCADIKVSFEFILPGLSVNLASARDQTPALVELGGAAAAATPSSASSEVSIPTMSLQEFEQDTQRSQDQRQQEQQSMSRSASSRAPTRPLPVPAAEAKSTLEAPSKILPPLPDGDA
jgi:hypothetical protein